MACASAEHAPGLPHGRGSLVKMGLPILTYSVVYVDVVVVVIIVVVAAFAVFIVIVIVVVVRVCVFILMSAKRFRVYTTSK